MGTSTFENYLFRVQSRNGLEFYFFFRSCRKSFGIRQKYTDPSVITGRDSAPQPAQPAAPPSVSLAARFGVAMEWSEGDDLPGALPQDCLEIILDHCDPRGLAALAATHSAFTCQATARAQEIAKELGYLLPVGTTVTAGRLATLQCHEEQAILLRDAYIEALSSRRFVDSSETLRRLLALDPLVLTRAGSVPQALLRDPAYRAYTLYLLPCLGEDPLWQRHVADIASVAADEDPGVRSTAYLALREVTKRMPDDELEIHAPTFALGLDDEIEFVRLAAVASMQRLSPRAIAMYQARLRAIADDDAERERTRHLARHTLERAGLGPVEVA
jgi:hypothetical protein